MNRGWAASAGCLVMERITGLVLQMLNWDAKWEAVWSSGGGVGAVLWKHNLERRQLRPHWRSLHLKIAYSWQAGSQVERPARLLFSGMTVTLLAGGWFPEWVGATAGFCSSQVEKEPEGKYLVEEPLKKESGVSLWVSLRPEVPIYL